MVGPTVIRRFVGVLFGLALAVLLLHHVIPAERADVLNLADSTPSAVCGDDHSDPDEYGLRGHRKFAIPALRAHGCVVAAREAAATMADLAVTAPAPPVPGVARLCGRRIDVPLPPPRASLIS